MLDLAVRLDCDDFRLDASLSASTGVTAIFGPSGAGKTTLAHAIAGLLRPDQGRIQLDEDVLFDSERGLWKPARDRRIGCVFQEARLFPHLTTEGNLRFALNQASGDSPVIGWDDAVQMFELGALLPRRPDRLSGGERQRVALARALLAAPRLLILDEPLASLDPHRRKRLVGYLRRLRDHLDLPLVYITHEPREIARFADEAVLMRGGHVLLTGAAHDVLSSEAFVALTGDPDPWSVLTPTVTEHTAAGATLLALGDLAFSVPRVDALPGEQVRLVVRGRDLLLSTATSSLEGISVRNAFPVEIGAMATQDGHCRIELKLGAARLAVRLPATTVRALDLVSGRRARVLIRSVAFEGRSLEPETCIVGDLDA